jgi:cell wall-associated NlpC family hydrolase
MTAPATALSQITAHIAQLQSLIASVSAPARGATSTGATGSSQFAAELAGATAPATEAAAGSASGTVTGADVVAQAKSYLGVPNVWGGESRSGIDCSGLVQASYHKLGIDLPRVAADQAHEGTEVPSLAQAQPGDLLTFGNPAYHIAIYLGDNKLIESPEPGKTVHITDVYQKPTSIRRILPSATAAASSAAAAGGVSAQQLSAAGLSSSVAGFANQFAAAEATHHLPRGLLAAMAQQESGGNVRAVSPAGAQGLMQLMPSTAAGLGVNAFDPDQAINAAAKIMSGNLSRFGSVPLALAAYNAGAGAVQQYGGIPPYAETQNYVHRITAMLAAGA